MKKPSDGPSSTYFGDARDEILRRAENVDLEASVNDVKHAATGEHQRYLSLQFPNGRNQRSTVITKEDAEIISGADFEHWVFLGEYNAILDRKNSSIEAVLSSNNRPSPLFVRRLIGLPGVEPLDSSGNPVNVSEEPEKLEDRIETYRLIELADGKHSIRPEDPWRIRLQTHSSPISAEISRPSIPFSRLFVQFDMPANSAYHLSLKVRKPGLSRHDDALEFLENYFASLSFEVDLRFDTMMALDRKRDRTAVPRRAATPGTSPITPPRKKYAKEAVSLYTYGRASSGRPLFQYLAYYQAIEFFFPSFHGEEVLRRLRNEIRDPRFDAEDDSNLQKVINIATNSGRMYTSEKEQLLATLHGSITDSDARDLIKQTHGMAEFFSKANHIKGVPEVSIGPRAKVVDLIAERVYKLRCRIVHTKSDGGGNLPEVLLPYSSEAEKMHYDLILIHYLCQKVIIAGSRGSLW
ncbi:hypothetical protein [Amycolatopsis vastitatis]|uniref:hypothetical protein n=1 Tax=Amycolatopsis vastitatis TaxID=1905142 RepID=UPI00117898F2|nr:hypothetical protein [Amycolatopsis vastitatis]